jgi:hypothetical protein
MRSEIENKKFKWVEQRQIETQAQIANIPREHGWT